MTEEDWALLLQRLEAEFLARASTVAAPRDEDAWPRLATVVLSVTNRILGRWGALSRDDREDISQTIIVRLQSQKGLHQIRSAASPEGYLGVMIRHAAIDLLRRREAERSVLAAVVEDSLSTLPQARSFHPGHTSRLAEVLRALSPTDLDLLEMRYIEQQSVGEIASHLNVKYAAAAQRLFRLLRRLRLALRE